MHRGFCFSGGVLLRWGKHPPCASSKNQKLFPYNFQNSSGQISSSSSMERLIVCIGKSRLFGISCLWELSWNKIQFGNRLKVNAREYETIYVKGKENLTNKEVFRKETPLQSASPVNFSYKKLACRSMFTKRLFLKRNRWKTLHIERRWKSDQLLQTLSLFVLEMQRQKKMHFRGVQLYTKTYQKRSMLNKK